MKTGYQSRAVFQYEEFVTYLGGMKNSHENHEGVRIH